MTMTAMPTSGYDAYTTKTTTPINDEMKMIAMDGTTTTGLIAPSIATITIVVTTIKYCYHYDCYGDDCYDHDCNDTN